MGQIYVNLKVKGSKKKEEVKNILVDSGATYSVLPKEVLERVGAFKYPDKIEIELGDGKIVLAEVYGVIIELNDRKGPANVITFPGAKSVVGAETLESLGLKLDPTTGKLEETRPKGVAYFYTTQGY